MIDKGIKTRLYTAARYFGEMQDLRRGGLPVVEAFLWRGSLLPFGGVAVAKPVNAF
jgi:hypothetical protein